MSTCNAFSNTISLVYTMLLNRCYDGVIYLSHKLYHLFKFQLLERDLINLPHTTDSDDYQLLPSLTKPNYVICSMASESTGCIIISIAIRLRTGGFEHL